MFNSLNCCIICRRTYFSPRRWSWLTADEGATGHWSIPLPLPIVIRSALCLSSDGRERRRTPIQTNFTPDSTCAPQNNSLMISMMETYRECGLRRGIGSDNTVRIQRNSDFLKYLHTDGWSACCLKTNQNQRSNRIGCYNCLASLVHCSDLRPCPARSSTYTTN